MDEQVTIRRGRYVITDTRGIVRFSGTLKGCACALWANPADHDEIHYARDGVAVKILDPLPADLENSALNAAEQNYLIRFYKRAVAAAEGSAAQANEAVRKGAFVVVGVGARPLYAGSLLDCVLWRADRRLKKMISKSTIAYIARTSKLTDAEEELAREWVGFIEID